MPKAILKLPKEVFSLECPYCGAELDCTDYYGHIQYANHYYEYPQSWIEKEGDIYKCPNCEGFESLEDVLEYIDGNEDDLEQYLKENGLTSWEEVVCESNTHNGSFYTDRSGNLYDGYPC